MDNDNFSKKAEPDLDWDMAEDYYSNTDEKKGLSLEEYAASEEENTFTIPPKINEEFEKVVSDVRNVRAASVNGKTIGAIAKEFNISEDYVANILITAQGYPEDNEVAIAHLVILG